MWYVETRDIVSEPAPQTAFFTGHYDRPNHHGPGRKDTSQNEAPVKHDPAQPDHQFGQIDRIAAVSVGTISKQVRRSWGMRRSLEQPASSSSEVLFASAEQEEIESRCYRNQARPLSLNDAVLDERLVHVAGHN